MPIVFTTTCVDTSCCQVVTSTTCCGETVREIRRGFDDTLSVRIGWQWRVTADVDVQAGFRWDPSPVPDATLDAPTLDSTTLAYSLGTTVRDVLYRGVDAPSLGNVSDAFASRPSR